MNASICGVEGNIKQEYGEEQALAENFVEIKMEPENNEIHEDDIKVEIKEDDS